MRENRPLNGAFTSVAAYSGIRQMLQHRMKTRPKIRRYKNKRNLPQRFKIYPHNFLIIQRCIKAKSATHLQLGEPVIQRVQALADILCSALCYHSNETRAPIANPPNSVQLEDTPYHSPNLHQGPCKSVGMWQRVSE